MKDKLKGLMLGIVIGSIVTGTTAFAGGLNIVPKTLGLYVDGENKESTQALMIYGTTYVPVRDVAKSMNKAITPDLKRNSLYIGSEPTQKGITFDEAVKLVKQKYKNFQRVITLIWIG